MTWAHTKPERSPSVERLLQKYKFDTMLKTEEMEVRKNTQEFEAYMHNKKYNGKGDRVDVIEMSKKNELVYERPELMPIFKQFYAES